MDCTRAQRLVDPFVDNELDVVTVIDLEEHLEACPECSWTHESRVALRSALRETELGFRAPAATSARLRTALRRAARGEPVPEPKARVIPFERPVASRRLTWVAAAAALVVVSVAAAAVWRFTAQQREEPFAREVVASHVRSLMASHLMDVPSTDQHTVKPWFDGKIDFAPPVVDLADREFPLVGGRLDYIDDQPVAALVYQRRLHVINLFVRPGADGSRDFGSDVYRGYNIVSWEREGMAYSAVSDLNAAELKEFATEFAARAAPPAAR